MTRPRRPWADRATVPLCAFARVTGPLCGPEGCGVGHYAVRLAPPVCAEHADDVGRVSAAILNHGRPVRRPAVRYAVARAFGLDVREDYAGGCVAELADVRPVVQWPRPEPSGLPEAWDAVRVVVPACSPECGERVTAAGGRPGAAHWGETCVGCGCVIGEPVVGEEVG